MQVIKKSMSNASILLLFICTSLIIKISEYMFVVLEALMKSKTYDIFIIT